MNLYPAPYRKHFLGVELVFSILVGVSLLYWWRYGNGVKVLTDIVRGNRAQVYSTLASIFGSLLGFVITALSVVLAFSTSERLKVLRGSSYYKQLWAVFTSAIRVLGATTVWWLLALFLDREAVQRPLILICCIATTFLAVLRLARCVWVLERIVEVMTSKGGAGISPTGPEI